MLVNKKRLDLQAITVRRIIDQFGRKRCQKKDKDVDYKLLSEFFQKYFVVHKRSARLSKIRSINTYFIGDRKDGVFLHFNSQKSSSRGAAISAMLVPNSRAFVLIQALYRPYTTSKIPGKTKSISRPFQA